MTPPKRNTIKKPTAYSIGVSNDDRAAPHRADPVEELHACRDGDEVGHETEERQQGRAGGEHVVCPDARRQGGDRDRGEDHSLVAEDGLAGERRQHVGDDAEVGQGEDVDLRMAEEPEEVLPQDGHAPTRDREDVRPEMPVAPEHDHAPRRARGRR